MYVELKTDNDGLVCSAALQEADKNGTKQTEQPLFRSETSLLGKQMNQENSCN